MTSFNDATAPVVIELTDDRGAFAVDVPQDWAQGRTAFGGLAAGMIVRAIEALPSLSGLPMRSLDIAFIGPLPAGAARIGVRVLRHGKYLSHVTADVVVDGSAEPAASAHAVLGRLRDSAVVVTPDPPHTVPMDDATFLPYLEGITPVFTKHFDYGFAVGDFPFTGSQRGELGGYCRHKTPADGVAAVAGLVDGWPGSVLPMLSGPSPASTVRWSLHLAGDDPMDGDAWHWYHATTVMAAGGYATSAARLWREGRLIAWSEQLFVVFDKKRA